MDFLVFGKCRLLSLELFGRKRNCFSSSFRSLATKHHAMSAPYRTSNSSTSFTPPIQSHCLFGGGGNGPPGPGRGNGSGLSFIVVGTGFLVVGRTAARVVIRRGRTELGLGAAVVALTAAAVVGFTAAVVALGAAVVATTPGLAQVPAEETDLRRVEILSAIFQVVPFELHVLPSTHPLKQFTRYGYFRFAVA